MELNAKSPSSQWEWDHLSFSNLKSIENPNWCVELDRENNAGLFNTPGGSGCSARSELIHGSKSASISSPSNRDRKTCIFPFESSQDDSNGKIESSNRDLIETCHAPELSSASGDPLLTLKLGKRMYFEDVCPESDSKDLSFARDLMSSLIVGKKSKSCGENLQSPCCQVEGCGLDLSSAKIYYRKHKVCESHSRSPKVVIAGLELRFCQQCSRFHGLFEFDEKKKSCRRRLSIHNARRRKARPPEAFEASQSALTSSPCDGKQQMSPYSRTATKDFLLKPAKDNIGIPSKVSDDSDVHFTSEVLASKSTNAGVEDFITFTDTNATQDFTGALSLLSTTHLDSYATKSISPEHSNRKTSNAQATTHAMSQHTPLDSSEYWHSDHDQQLNSSTWISNSNCMDNNHFQEFQLFREPYESGFHQLD